MEHRESVTNWSLVRTSCRWMGWAWTSITWQRTCIRTVAWYSAMTPNPVGSGPTSCLHTFKHDSYEQAWDSLVEWRRGLRGKKRFGGDSTGQLPGGPSRHDQLSRVRLTRLANRQRPDGIPLQNEHLPPEGPRPSLGHRRSGSGGRTDHTERQRPMAIQLANSSIRKKSTPPGLIARPGRYQDVRKT